MSTSKQELPTAKMVEQMSDKERLVALRLLDRRENNVKKLWNGRVSEAKKEYEHKIEADVPARDAECRQQLEAIKMALDVLDDTKSKRKSAIDAIRSAAHEILYAAPATAEQLELGATRAPITKTTQRELSAALEAAKADDLEAEQKGETPKVPPESVADMDDLRRKLDAMMADSGLGSVSFPDPITADQLETDGAVDAEENTSKRRTSKGRGNLTAVNTH